MAPQEQPEISRRSRAASHRLSNTSQGAEVWRIRRWSTIEAPGGGEAMARASGMGCGRAGRSTELHQRFGRAWG